MKEDLRPTVGRGHINLMSENIGEQGGRSINLLIP